jgi:hypothetical protein
MRTCYDIRLVVRSCHRECRSGKYNFIFLDKGCFNYSLSPTHLATVDGWDRFTGQIKRTWHFERSPDHVAVWWYSKNTIIQMGCQSGDCGRYNWSHGGHRQMQCVEKVFPMIRAIEWYVCCCAVGTERRNNVICLLAANPVRNPKNVLRTKKLITRHRVVTKIQQWYFRNVLGVGNRLVCVLNGNATWPSGRLGWLNTFGWVFRIDVGRWLDALDGRRMVQTYCWIAVDE